MAAWDLDFAGETSESLESGGYPAAGFYMAKLTATTPDQQDGGQNFDFIISVGPFAGKKVSRKLWNPGFADTEERKQNAIRHAKSWAHRLGLDGPGKVSIVWEQAIGKEYVVEVTKRKYTKKDGSQGEMTEIAYMGVYQKDHYDIPEAFRVQNNLGPAKPRPAGSKPPSSSTTTQAPAATADDVANLAKSLWN